MFNKNPIETRLVKQTDTELWRECELLEYEVFVEQNYIAENPEKRLTDYDKYDHFYLAATIKTDSNSNARKKVVGVLRCGHTNDILTMRTNLYSTLDAQESMEFYLHMKSKLLQLDPGSVIDLAAMAISRKHRDSRVSRALIARFIIEALRLVFEQQKRAGNRPQLRYILAAADERVYRRFLARSFPLIGMLPIESLGKPVMYWGSLTVPIILDADAAITPKLHKILFKLNQGIAALYQRGWL